MKGTSSIVNNPHAGNPGANSDVAPVAQSLELLQLRDIVEREQNKLRVWIEQNRYESEYLKALISLMADYGLRISEILGIKATDMGSLGTIKIRGAKGSQNRYIRPLRFTHIWGGRRLTMASFISGCSRFYIYRVCKRYGFYLSKEGGENKKVTHYFRYLYLMSLRVDEMSKEDIKSAIGHKNVNSQEYYNGKNFKTV